jgi:hypothetical protein
VREHLPAYALDDGTDDEANERERVEYAGDEIKRLLARLAAMEGALRRIVDTDPHKDDMGFCERCNRNSSWPHADDCPMTLARAALATPTTAGGEGE